MFFLPQKRNNHPVGSDANKTISGMLIGSIDINEERRTSCANFSKENI